jgi:hypothetical protein
MGWATFWADFSQTHLATLVLRLVLKSISTSAKILNFSIFELDLKPDLKPVLKPDLKPDLKPVLKPDLKPVLKPDLKPVLKPDLKPVLQSVSELASS